MKLFTNEMKELKRPDEPLFKTPKTVQQTLEIQKVSENGIFQLSNTRYSKTYKFKDINYITSNNEEREDIIEAYCKLLNTFDCRFKVTIANENIKDCKNKKHLREKNRKYTKRKRLAGFRRHRRKRYEDEENEDNEATPIGIKERLIRGLRVRDSEEDSADTFGSVTKGAKGLKWFFKVILFLVKKLISLLLLPVMLIILVVVLIIALIVGIIMMIIYCSPLSICSWKRNRPSTAQAR